MKRTLAFIQARMSSSRFPGKAVEPLDARPMIVYMAGRAARASYLDGVVVITSTDLSDDPVADAAVAASVSVFRGDLNDVLGRYADAAQAFGADEIVRLTGDCPLIDPKIIDAVVNARQLANADYSSNCDPPTYPDGLDVECFTLQTLMLAHRHASCAADREHVTLWMRTDEAMLKRVNYRAIADLSALRLTVDYPDDMEVVRRILARLPAEGNFDLFDILRVLSMEPELAEINRHPRNEGLGVSHASKERADE